MYIYIYPLSRLDKRRVSSIASSTFIKWIRRPSQSCVWERGGPPKIEKSPSQEGVVVVVIWLVLIQQRLCVTVVFSCSKPPTLLLTFLTSETRHGV